jgi:hypothetical protein
MCGLPHTSAGRPAGWPSGAEREHASSEHSTALWPRNLLVLAQSSAFLAIAGVGKGPDAAPLAWFARRFRKATVET